MKVNEAPEKIWVHELSAKELNVPLKEYHIEYIRKDAFIEKAIDWLRKELFDYLDAPKGDYDMLIDDFTEYIKQAMKDE